LTCLVSYFHWQTDKPFFFFFNVVVMRLFSQGKSSEKGYVWQCSCSCFLNNFLC